MSDLISRQAAIDAFNTNLNELVVGGEENAKTVENYLNRVLDKIKCLPSALGTNLAEVGTDLISRAQAIDALRTCYDTETITMDNGDEYINYGDAVGEIEQLPSAQPKNENLKFLEFLWNTINPNEMEQYLEMYSSKEVKSNG